MTSSAKLTLPDAPRLVIARPDRVGDVIISTSCIAPVRQSFPGSRLYFLAQEFARPLLENHPDLDGFLATPMEADAIVHLHPDEQFYRAARHIPVRIGYRGPSSEELLTHSIPDSRHEGRKHEAQYNFDLLRLLGIPEPPVLRPSIHLAERYRESLRAKLPWPVESTRFAVLNPSAHSKVARWPAEYFVQLADWLRNERGLQVVIIGADAADALSLLGVGNANLAGKTDLGELGWLLKHASVLVSRDTGPSHLAAAVGCPVVVIFGRTAPMYGPTRWRPLTDKAVVVVRSLRKRTFESRDAYWRRSFAAIPVEEIQRAVLQAMREFRSA